MLRSILQSEFSTFSTELVLLIRENLVFEREVMEKSDYSQWGRGLLGWTKTERSWILIVCLLNIYLCKKEQVQ